MQLAPTVYRSYLLRLWWDAAEGNWRVSLQSTATEQTVYFPTVEALQDYLLAQPAPRVTGEAPTSGLLSPTEP